MADEHAPLPAGPFLLRAKGKEVRIQTLIAVRRMIISDFADCDVVVIDLASGKRIIFKGLGGAVAPSSSDSSTISAPAHDRPGFFLSAATELEVVPAENVKLDPPSPPTPRPVRTRSTDYARPLSPLPPRPPSSPSKGSPVLLWVSAAVACLLVVIVLAVVASSGHRKEAETHDLGAPAPKAKEPPPAPPADTPRSAEIATPSSPKPAPPQVVDTAKPPLGGPGLVAHYLFDDASNLGKDSSGHHHDAISSDGVTIGFDPVLKRPVLILLGHSEVRLVRSIGRDFTITMWLNTTMNGTSLPDAPNMPWYNGAGLLDADVPGARADFGSSVLNGRLAFGTGDPDTTLRSTSTIADGKWHFLAIKRANTGRVQLFVDALMETGGDCPAGERNAPATMVIGRLMSGANFLVARLSSLRLYERMLSDQQILDLLHGEGAAP